MELLKRAALSIVALLGFSGLFCLNSSAQSNQPQVLYFPHLADGAGYSSTWRFTGLSAGTSVVTVELFDQDGNPLTIATDNGTGSIFRFTLQRSGSASLQTLGAGPTVRVGWAKITATQRIGASEHFRLIGAGGSVVSEAEVSASPPLQAVTLIIPDSRNAALALLNVNTDAIDFTFNLIAMDGNLVATGSRRLAAHGQAAFYQSQIPGLERAAILNGSLEVFASGPFSVTTLSYDGQTFSTAPVLSVRAGHRASLLSSMALLRDQLNSATDEFLSPSADDIAPYAAFLNLPGTGVILLTPRGKYDDLIPIRGGGSYYSFNLLTHEYGYGSDLELDQSQFRVGFAGIDFGFMAALGNIPIEGVNAATPGVQYLASYTPPSTISDARAEQQRAGIGFSADGYSYRNRAAAQADTTYALRSVCYESSDLLVAFRVLRFDTDGSAILVWKRISGFAVPHAN